MLVASHSQRVIRQFTSLLLMVGLIVGCSRDNPLSTPDAYVEPEIPFCTDESPFSFELLKRVDFTNINNDIVVESDSFSNELPDDEQNSAAVRSVNNRLITYSASAPYLSNATTITPIPLTDYKRNELGEVELNDEGEPIILLLNKELSLDVLQNLSEEAVAELEAFTPQVSTIAYKIDYYQDNQLVTKVFDDTDVSLDARLLEGANKFGVKVTARVIVPKTGLECASDTNDDEITRIVTLEYEYAYSIDRDFLSAFTPTDLEIPAFLSSANNQLGSVIKVEGDFLVLGIPDESSGFTGVIPFIDIETSYTETASQSGAVLVYSRNEEARWVPHSVIKSSNNEAGDRFGSAISLYGNTMVVSAPGEDSNASGIHATDSVSAVAHKINNNALDSGAAFLFTFNEETNSWTESHYIKPPSNMVSDGKYDKSFGEEVLLSNNLLLIAAPGEDSLVGAADDSRLPDSGAVYTYSFSQDPLTLTFVSTIKAFNPGAGDLFGSTMALTDNLIAIGAPFEDSDSRTTLANVSENSDLSAITNNNRLNSGAVYLFSRLGDGSIVDPFMYIKSSNSDAEDFFGASLVLSDTMLFVGAPGEDGSGTGLNRDMQTNGSSDSGAVYLFSLNETSNRWIESTYIKSVENQAQSFFGQHIDFNKNNLVISAPAFDTDVNSNAGKVYLYAYMDDEIFYNQEFLAAGSSKNMQLGKTLAIKNQYLVLGASAFSGTDSGTGNAIPFMGKVLSYQ